MPEYLAPGVYVEEVERGSKSIEGVSTSTAGFLGETERASAIRDEALSKFAGDETALARIREAAERAGIGG